MIAPPKICVSKRCPDCKKVKTPGEFGFRVQSGRTYLRSICRICVMRRTKNWQKQNRDKFCAYQRVYAREKYWANLEKARARHRKMYHERKQRGSLR